MYKPLLRVKLTLRNFPLWQSSFLPELDLLSGVLSHSYVIIKEHSVVVLELPSQNRKILGKEGSMHKG